MCRFPSDPIKADSFPASLPVPVSTAESNPAETDQEAVKQEVFPEGSSVSLPVPAEEAEAPQATGTQVLSKPREEHQARVFEFYSVDSGVVSKSDMSASNPENTSGGLCPQDKRKRCMVATAATLIVVPLVLLFVYVMIRHWHKQRKERQRSAASPVRPDPGSFPSHPDSRTRDPGPLEYRTQRSSASPQDQGPRPS
ncbi:uncharacterized protein FYW35_005015 [Pterocles gutturalis]